MAANLPGSGVLEDPYLIESYEDFSKMDSLETGAYYKLVKDINMIGRKWYGVNLNGGYLDLSDRKIENIDIADGSFCFYAGTIYAQREEWFDSVKIKENKAGYILNITSELCSFIFKNIDFIRIGWSIINISSSAANPVDNISGLESYFWISSLNFKNSFITLKQVSDSEYSLCDCVVSINGNFFDNNIIYQYTAGRNDMQKCTIKRCLITGKIKMLGRNERGSMVTHNGVLVNCTCMSSIIDIEHDPETYDGSDYVKMIKHVAFETYYGKETSPNTASGSSLIIKPVQNDVLPIDTNNPGVYIDSMATSGFTVVTKNQLLNTGYLKTIQFNVEPEK